MDTAPEPFLLLEPEAAPRLETLPSILPAAQRFAGGGHQPLSEQRFSRLACRRSGARGW
jgi:hypothetical protein